MELHKQGGGQTVGITPDVARLWRRGGGCVRDIWRDLCGAVTQGGGCISEGATPVIGWVETADVAAPAAAAALKKLSTRFRKSSTQSRFPCLFPLPVPLAAFPLFTFVTTDKESEATPGRPTGTAPTPTKKVFLPPSGPDELETDMKKAAVTACCQTTWLLHRLVFAECRARRGAVLRVVRGRGLT